MIVLGKDCVMALLYQSSKCSSEQDFYLIHPPFSKEGFQESVFLCLSVVVFLCLILVKLAVV